MTSTGTAHGGTRLSARALGVLVLTLIAGLLAMHALMAPQPTAPTATGSAAPAASGPHLPGGCGHQGGAPGGGHVDHADATCAAAGTAAPWTSPGLTPALPGAEPGSAAPHARHAAPRATDRAPPDLADLQLLRI